MGSQQGSIFSIKKLNFSGPLKLRMVDGCLLTWTWNRKELRKITNDSRFHKIRVKRFHSESSNVKYTRSS